MRSTALLLVISLSVALCSSDLKSQGNLFSGEVQVNLEKSHIGRVILRLATLRSKVAQFDFSKLFDALDELEQSLKERSQEESDQFGDSGVQYAVDVDYYGVQITTNENDVSTHEIDIEDLESSRASLETTLATKRIELSNSQNLKQGVDSVLVTNQATFDAQLGGYADAIGAIDQALELLAQAREGSFVEYTHSKLIGTEMQDKLSALKHRRVMFQPLIESFLHLASKNFVDQNALQKIIKLLQDLRDNLDNSRLALTNQFQVEAATNQDLQETYAALLESLSEEVIPQFITEIGTLEGQISSKQIILSDSNANLKAAQQNLESVENRWLTRQATNTDLIGEFNTQLAIVSQAVTHLERAGIKRS